MQHSFSNTHQAEALQVAHELFRQGDWPRAMAAYQQLAKEGCEAEIFYLDYGYLLLALGQFDQLMSQLQPGVAKFSQNLDLLSRWKINGDLMMELGQPEAIVGTAPVTQQDQAFLWIAPCSVDEMGGGQHPPQIARCLADLGYRVDYIQVSSGAKVQETFNVLQDPFLLQRGPMTPYQQERMAALLAPFLADSAQHKTAVFMVFSPYLLEWIPYLKARGVQVIYWCLDRWETLGWPDVPLDTERRLMAMSDGLLATARSLQVHLETQSGKRCEWIPNGFQASSFMQNSDIPIPADWRRGKHLTFVYWGNLANNWIDWDWFLAIAQAHPEWQFNLIGNVQEDRKQRIALPNITFLGEKQSTELYAYGAHADFGFIHFQVDETTQAVNPVKVYEYLACGLPVISTPMPELNGMPGVFQVNDVAGFEAAVNTILSLNEAQQGQLQTERQAFLKSATWEARAKLLVQYCQDPFSPLLECED